MAATTYGPRLCADTRQGKEQSRCATTYIAPQGYRAREMNAARWGVLCCWCRLRVVQMKQNRPPDNQTKSQPSVQQLNKRRRDRQGNKIRQNTTQRSTANSNKNPLRLDKANITANNKSKSSNKTTPYIREKKKKNTAVHLPLDGLDGIYHDRHSSGVELLKALLRVDVHPRQPAPEAGVRVIPSHNHLHRVATRNGGWECRRRGWGRGSQQKGSGG